jgi:pSer/pThr/pTyr-binding forkhead associated (FHA) protein
MEVKLVVLEGKHKAHEIPLPETIFLIGRDPQCHIRPHCQGVSNLHCAIAAWAGKVRLRDLKSRNGTFLNGQPVHGEVLVADGDRLQVGTLLFAFHIKNADGTPRAEPIKNERDVEWLLRSPDDSDVLSPARRRTCVVPNPSGPAEGADNKLGVSEPARSAALGNAVTTPGSKAVSAGQHLRTYIEERKRRVNPAAGPELPNNGL